MLGRVGLRDTSHLVGDTHEGHALAAGLFRVDKAFFHAGYDLLVLTGAIERVPVQAGMCVVLRGESDSTHVVPIASLEYVEFTTGPALALTVPYAAIQGTALEPGALEGLTLEVRAP